MNCMVAAGGGACPAAAGFPGAPAGLLLPGGAAATAVGGPPNEPAMEVCCSLSALFLWSCLCPFTLSPSSGSVVVPGSTSSSSTSSPPVRSGRTTLHAHGSGVGPRAGCECVRPAPRNGLVLCSPPSAVVVVWGFTEGSREMGWKGGGAFPAGLGASFPSSSVLVGFVRLCRVLALGV